MRVMLYPTQDASVMEATREKEEEGRLKYANHGSRVGNQVKVERCGASKWDQDVKGRIADTSTEAD